MLPVLYDSLVKQDSLDFEWLIVDDGSTDNTSEIVKSFSCNLFPIRYFYKDNGGKHTAYNLGISLAQGDFFICVDSDDYLIPNSISLMQESITKMHPSDIGIVFPQVNNSKINNKNWTKIHGKSIDIIDTTRLYRIKETAILIKTQILRKYSFPTIDERYCPESVLYNQMIKGGHFLAINKGFYVSEYQVGGLSYNIRKMFLNNPNCFILDQNIKYRIYGKYNFLTRVFCRAICIIEINAICIKRRIRILKKTPSRFSSVVLFIPSFLFMLIKYRRCY